MKILSVVVTFFPEEDLLRKNVSAFIDHVDKVLVWENTPKEEKLKYRFIQHKKVEYCGDGANSISHALNSAWHYAQENGYDYLLTMDQDSVWENFQLFLKKTIYSENAPEGIWTPLVIERELNSDYEKIFQPITSGMLIRIDLLNMIGGWNELFTIDNVDDEFSLRSHKIGCDFYIVRGTRMKQNFGEPETANFCGYPIVLTNYTPKRLYHIFRNLVVLIRMYPEQKYIKNNFVSWIKRIFFIVCYEKEKFNKIKSILSGIKSGMKYTIR